MAKIYVLGICLLIGFQAALIAGAPWGHLTQGGRCRGRLDRTGRLLALVSIPVLVFMAGGIASAGGSWPHWPAWAGWAAAGVQAVSALGNWITPSQAERVLWGPVITAMLVLALVILLG